MQLCRDLNARHRYGAKASATTVRHVLGEGLVKHMLSTVAQIGRGGICRQPFQLIRRRRSKADLESWKPECPAQCQCKRLLHSPQELDLQLRLPKPGLGKDAETAGPGCSCGSGWRASSRTSSSEISASLREKATKPSFMRLCNTAYTGTQIAVLNLCLHAHLSLGLETI